MGYKLFCHIQVFVRALSSPCLSEGNTTPNLPLKHPQGWFRMVPSPPFAGNPLVSWHMVITCDFPSPPLPSWGHLTCSSTQSAFPVSFSSHATLEAGLLLSPKPDFAFHEKVEKWSCRCGASETNPTSDHEFFDLRSCSVG